MSDLKPSTVKALTEYGYVESEPGIFLRPGGKQLRWEWTGDAFRHSTHLVGQWYPVPNHFDSRFNPATMGNRERDHSNYEHPECWVWDFTEDDVRTTYARA